VFGGEQIRGFIHIEDMANLYRWLLWESGKAIQRKIYNAGWENHKVLNLAKIVRDNVSNRIPMQIIPTDDNRSYRICSKKIERELGFFPMYTIKDAVLHMKRAFMQGRIPNPLRDAKYYNVKMMRAKKLR